MCSSPLGGGGGGTPYNDLHWEAPHERSTFLRLQVSEREGFSLVEVNKRVGNMPFGPVQRPKKPKREQMHFDVQKTKRQ